MPGEGRSPNGPARRRSGVSDTFHRGASQYADTEAESDGYEARIKWKDDNETKGDRDARAHGARGDGSPSSTSGTTSIDPDVRRQLVAAEAYFLAERRGFAAGHELEDWVAALAALGNLSNPAGRH